MNVMPRRVALAVAALASVLLAAPAVPAGAEPGTGGGANNIVRVYNEEDATFHSRASAQIAQSAGPIVGNTNLASAEASCTDCQAVAVAVQVVIASGDASIYEPGNAATAVNYECTGCRSFAYARQVVLWTDRPVALSPGALADVRWIESEMQEVAASGAPDSEMWPVIHDLSEQLIAVVEGEIAAAGTSATRTTREHADRRVA